MLKMPLRMYKLISLGSLVLRICCSLLSANPHEYISHCTRPEGNNLKPHTTIRFGERG